MDMIEALKSDKIRVNNGYSRWLGWYGEGVPPCWIVFERLPYHKRTELYRGTVLEFALDILCSKTEEE